VKSTAKREFGDSPRGVPWRPEVDVRPLDASSSSCQDAFEPMP
jgi:hypothetical protein